MPAAGPRLCGRFRHFNHTFSDGYINLGRLKAHCERSPDRAHHDIVHMHEKWPLLVVRDLEQRFAPDQLNIAAVLAEPHRRLAVRIEQQRRTILERNASDLADTAHVTFSAAP